MVRMLASGMGSAMSFDVIGIVLFIIKENKMARIRNQYSNEFKQTVCEYYSNHTWRVTAVHFGMAENGNTARLYTNWYKVMGFLPKSAGMNPNMARVKTVSASKKRANSGVFISSGGVLIDNEFLGNAEWVDKKSQYHPSDTYYEVIERKVGDTVKRNPIAKLFSKFM